MATWVGWGALATLPVRPGLGNGVAQGCTTTVLVISLPKGRVQLAGYTLVGECMGQPLISRVSRIYRPFSAWSTLLCCRAYVRHTATCSHHKSFRSLLDTKVCTGRLTWTPSKANLLIRIKGKRKALLVLRRSGRSHTVTSLRRAQIA